MDPDELNRELLRRREAARRGGGSKAVDKQHARGKLTARERIARLLDSGSFEEMDPYITHRHRAFGLDQKRFPGDSVVVGFGRLDGRKVALAAQDFTVIGGSFSEVQAQKVCKVLDLAIGSGVPFIALNDSVGARIQEGVWSLAGYSELFWRNTQASGVIPQISVMLGPCAGGSV
ncbi:MAG TPA: methylmalonyl-CoA carboxyltransferase, partial [Anaerolineae bacterium]|nr:methylmalonyl-CoA carboxyltransferase [Anaerolineae bacterium]